MSNAGVAAAWGTAELLQVVQTGSLAGNELLAARCCWSGKEVSTTGCSAHAMGMLELSVVALLNEALLLELSSAGSSGRSLSMAQAESQSGVEVIDPGRPAASAAVGVGGADMAALSVLLALMAASRVGLQAAWS